LEIDAKKMNYKDLNAKIRQILLTGEKELILHNVNGQRYIGDNLGNFARIIIQGVPGNDLGFCLAGPELIVKANAQDALGNTMGAGKIVIHGNCGDICGYAMRGGKIFIKDNVGYRAGIHMKEYKENFPIIVIGGIAGDFLGEYMAGGVILVLGQNKNDQNLIGNYCGTGMHGGCIFLRGEIPLHNLGKQVKIIPLSQEDNNLLNTILTEYCHDIGIPNTFKPEEFCKLIPESTRPYGLMYAY
jgi:glutamate synthase domain-containing protein 3